MKLLVREIQKSLPSKHFDYLISLLDLTFFGCLLVSDLQSLKAENAAAAGAETDTLERCANSATDAIADAEPAAEQAVDGQDQVLASLLTSGLSTNFDSLCEDEQLRQRIGKVAEEFATTTIGNLFTMINNVTKQLHSENSWKKDLENPGDFDEVSKVLEKTLQGLSGNNLRKVLDEGKKAGFSCRVLCRFALLSGGLAGLAA